MNVSLRIVKSILDLHDMDPRVVDDLNAWRSELFLSLPEDELQELYQIKKIIEKIPLLTYHKTAIQMIWDKEMPNGLR